MRPAGALHQEGLTLRREVEDPRGVALSLAFLGWAVSRQGDYARAVALLEEALALFRDVGMPQLVAFAASVLAEVAHAQGGERARHGALSGECAAVPRPRGQVRPRSCAQCPGMPCTPRVTPWAATAL